MILNACVRDNKMVSEQVCKECLLLQEDNLVLRLQPNELLEFIKLIKKDVSVEKLIIKVLPKCIYVELTELLDGWGWSDYHFYLICQGEDSDDLYECSAVLKRILERVDRVVCEEERYLTYWEKYGTKERQLRQIQRLDVARGIKEMINDIVRER